MSIQTASKSRALLSSSKSIVLLKEDWRLFIPNNGLNIDSMNSIDSLIAYNDSMKLVNEKKEKSRKKISRKSQAQQISTEYFFTSSKSGAVYTGGSGSQFGLFSMSGIPLELEPFDLDTLQQLKQEKKPSNEDNKNKPDKKETFQWSGILPNNRALRKGLQSFSTV